MKPADSALTATTWWLLGASLALDASLVSNPLLLALILLASFTTMLIFAAPEKRLPAIKLYGTLSLSVLAVRLLFRVIFNQASFGQDIALDLPSVVFSLAGHSVSFLGAVSWLSLNSAFIDGLRLAAIIMGFALANTVANPRKLLRSTPSALYEVATAAAVAINLAPQFLLSLKRARRARELRGHAKGIRSFTGIVVPLLEDTVQKSLDLAASMDSRGFGRRGEQTALVTNLSRLSSMIGLVALSVTVYLLLATETPIWVSLALASVTLLSFVATLRMARLHSTRTRLSLEKRTWRDFAVSGVAIGLVMLLAVTRVPELGLLGWTQ